MSGAISCGAMEMGHKRQATSVLSKPSITRTVSESDLDTEFEEDVSDFDDYQGRKSEESFGNTTISTYDDLRTPLSNEFKGFNFGLPLQVEVKKPARPVEGPVGPHLFRYSFESTPVEELYLEWSPPPSPRRLSKQKRVSTEAPAPDDIPLEQWTPLHVAGWMRKVGFEDSLVEKFRSNDISGSLLQQLQFGDLKELGIASFGHRHMLWDEIRNLRGSVSVPSTPRRDDCLSPTLQNDLGARDEASDVACSTVANADELESKTPKLHRRRARRALRPDDMISPAESASIVAIEQLLPEPHHCSKGENCAKWRKYKRKMDRIAKEFPLELEQIEDANASSSEVNLPTKSETGPSVVASSDLLGPGYRPALRLDSDVLRHVQNRDPQENVRQFLDFQHLADVPAETDASPYEMFPPLSPPENTPGPHSNLRSLPKLTIPAQIAPSTPQDPDRTIVQQHRTPITAIQDHGQCIYRFASPASAMDVPVTAIPNGPIERDSSNSVPPDMRYGQDPISRASSRNTFRANLMSPIERSQSTQPMERSASLSQRRQHPRFGMPALRETVLSPIHDADEKTPTVSEYQHAGWMKKRKTKMLRHEWHENHFRLKGTTLAMHRDSKELDALEYIDVDDYAVACSSLASNKVNTAFKALKLSGNHEKKKKETDPLAFTFQLVPAAEKKGFIGAATGKTHHFAVKNREDRIDWMRELMLAKAMREKRDGCEVNVNGQIVV